jgi:hypothetical protein
MCSNIALFASAAAALWGRVQKGKVRADAFNQGLE